MKSQKKKIMKIRPATLIAMLALFVAIGGTATAAGLINGKQIRKGTVTGKAFKNQTITKSRISTSAIAALAGAEGPRGAPGERGETGLKGATGNQGVPGAPGTTTFTGSATKVAQFPNLDVNQVVLNNLPGSRYVSTAKVSVISQTAGTQVSCKLQGGGLTDEAKWTTPFNSARGILWMVLSTSMENTSVKVVCNAGASSATFKTILTTIPAL